MRPYLLAAGSFAVGATTYIVTGLLPTAAAELGVGPGTAGQLVTAFALAYALAAPLLAAATGRWERRSLLTVALLVVAIGNLLTAAAPNLTVALVGRVVTALGAAVYTPAATMVATRLLPPGSGGRAVALVFGGLTVSLLIGVPAGNLLGTVWGFRGVFVSLAVLAVVAAVAVRFVLPAVAAPPPVGLRARLAQAGDRQVLGLLGVTALGVLGALTLYVYLVPVLRSAAAIPPAAVGLLLAVYGVGAVMGNAIGGRAADRFRPAPTLTVVIIGVVVLAAALPLALTSLVGTVVILLAWSVACWTFNPPLQALLLARAAAAGRDGGLVLSLNASAIFVGSGLAGVIGGLVVDHAGPAVIPPVSAGIALTALAVWLTVRRDPPHRPLGPPPLINPGVPSSEHGSHPSCASEHGSRSWGAREPRVEESGAGAC